MASEIAQVLAETLSHDNNRRVAAELKLAKLSEYPGKSRIIIEHSETCTENLREEAGLALAQLIVTQGADVPLRQMSPICQVLW